MDDTQSRSPFKQNPTNAANVEPHDPTRTPPHVPAVPHDMTAGEPHDPTRTPPHVPAVSQDVTGGESYDPTRTPPHVRKVERQRNTRPPLTPMPTLDSAEDEIAQNPSGMGCRAYALIAVLALLMAGVLVGVAGFAGWQTGMREAQSNGQATQQFEINRQLTQIPNDVAMGSAALLAYRVAYLRALDVPVEPFIPTVTAVYLASLPTATLPPTATFTPTAISEVTAAPTSPPIATQSDGTLDQAVLAEYLTRANTALSVSDWLGAIDWLNVIISADPTYQAPTVRAMMSEALGAQALLYLRSPQPSELALGIAMVDEARLYGPLNPPDLEFESAVAAQYLDALRLEGTDYPRAIQSWTNLYGLAPNYRDVRSRMVGQIVAYGDSFSALGQPCAAVGQYQFALTYVQDFSISNKLTAAQNACTLAATPIGGLPSAGGITPVGVGS
jgi:hypothetical protein